MAAKTDRYELRVDAELLEQVDDWRRIQPDVPSRAESIRILVREGIASAQERSSMNGQLYEMMKLQLFGVATRPENANKIEPAYVFAWRNGVYPIFHDVEWHKPFSEHFEVTEAMMDDLVHHLDNCDLEKAIPTFYELESHYRVRMAGSEWNRSKLLSACRYARLDRRWGDAFWNAILRDNDHPAEARGILLSFSLKDDVHFA